jgi:hypothetical protein
MEVNSFVRMKTNKFFVCVVNLLEGWKIKNRIKFVLKNCSIDV